MGTDAELISSLQDAGNFTPLKADAADGAQAAGDQGTKKELQ